ncbi:MAG: flagellar basal body-associated FliL family protein [Deltaproteobacteria bacterium]|nr:flagellar basal body-associated FliL family protein [Deltaproteobacteria bacterium]
MKDEDRPETAGEEKATKKGFPLKLVILLVVVLGLAGGGGYAWKAGVLKKLLGGGKPAHAAKEQKVEIGPIRPMETFIVNLADPMGKRYLKVKMELELDGEGVLPEIEKRLPQMKDTILTTLSSKTFDDVNTLEGKMQLRMELMAMLNQYLKMGKIANIYFTEFIVQ